MGQHIAVAIPINSWAGAEILQTSEEVEKKPGQGALDGVAEAGLAGGGRQIKGMILQGHANTQELITLEGLESL